MRFLIDLLNIFAVPRITIQKDGHGGKERTDVIDGGCGRMKLIIDIPEERLDSIKHFGIKQNEVSMLERALINGTPLDSVIEEYVERGAITENMRMLYKIDSIKAEIKALQGENYFIGFNTCKKRVLGIIDKHMRGTADETDN